MTFQIDVKCLIDNSGVSKVSDLKKGECLHFIIMEILTLDWIFLDNANKEEKERPPLFLAKRFSKV